jgi:hypothetical protein
VIAGQFKHTYKIVIAGNHECTFDEGFLRSTSTCKDPRPNIVSS